LGSTEISCTVHLSETLQILCNPADAGALLADVAVDLVSRTAIPFVVVKPVEASIGGRGSAVGLA
jgi:hypothetical protein